MRGEGRRNQQAKHKTRHLGMSRKPSSTKGFSGVSGWIVKVAIFSCEEREEDWLVLGRLVMSRYSSARTRSQSKWAWRMLNSTTGTVGDVQGRRAGPLDGLAVTAVKRPISRVAAELISEQGGGGLREWRGETCGCRPTDRD